MSTSADVGVKASPPSYPNPFQEEQAVLILVGLVASGKSTFATALESHFPRFRRCNQDDLGNRHLVEELAYHTLSEGRSPCIDRTNFNAVQRSYWSAIAHEFPGTSISIIVFDTPYDVCASRLQRRTSHPTITDPQLGLAILQKFASDFQLPSPGEGYDHILYLRPEDHPRPEYTRDDVLSILKRLKASTRVSEAGVTQRSTETHFGYSGGYSRTNRARGCRGGGGRARARGTLCGPSRTMSKAGGSDNANWRRPGPSVATVSAQGPTATANVPLKEGTKGSDSARERHNSA